MRYLLLTVFLCGLFSWTCNAKGRPTVVSAEIYGYQGDKVHFDFLEKEGINMEFPYKDGQLMEFTVDLDDITTLKLNTFIEVFLQPGDSIHLKVTYKGRNYDKVEFSGTPAAVTVNTKVYEKEMLQRERRYKTNIPAMLVTQVDAKKFHEATVQELKDEKAILDKVKGEITPEMYNMVLSSIEGTLLTNLITYPYASAEVHKKKLEDCMTADYWRVLNEYKLRDDKASLRNRAYMCMLSPYKDYVREREARAAGKEYKAPTSIEEQYKDLAAFYEGALRDTALFVFLYDAVAANKDFDMVEKLVKDYLKKYNKEKEYKKILNQVMQ
ncbi:MAG: hypothetical protein SOY65_11530 [Marinifilaceae bacterium]|nr:hypothetical protein [Marinifilaceae bacterium]